MVDEEFLLANYSPKQEPRPAVRRLTLVGTVDRCGCGWGGGGGGGGGGEEVV